MAVEVEDHPLGYASFEGDIPKGQYGGGHVALFDRGTWTTEGDVAAQLAKGHLRFELHGERLKGGWHLVRSGKPARQPQWLLFKQDDAWAAPKEADDLLQGVTPPPTEDVRRARRLGANKRIPAAEKATPKRASRIDWQAEAAALPSARKRAMPAKLPAPQLARLVDAPPQGDDWLHELKWDGYRLLGAIRKGVATLWSRNGLNWTERVPEVRDALATLGLRDAIVDGELVTSRGSREDFNLLQQVLSGERQGQLRCMLFDLLYVDGIDLSKVGLIARKALLERLLAKAPMALGYSSHGVGQGAEAFKAAVKAGFEGIVSKRVDAISHSGRGDDWRKCKALASAEYAVIGYTPPKGSRAGIGSLLLATPDKQHGWRYVGRVGSGFSDAQLRELGKALRGKGGNTPVVHVPENDTDLRQAKWLPKPLFVVEVFERGIGGRGLLRQASFKALRPDKSIASLTDSDRGSNGPGEKKVATKRTVRRKTTPKTRQPPTLTSPDKLLFPDDGIDKRELADYYATVMDWLLPEIANRPLSVVRCPGGIGAQCFFQKHATPGFELVSRVPIEESDGGTEDYLVAEDAASVMELVQFNSIEFHPWGTHIDDIERCDRLVFDLDPDAAVAWKDVVAAARQLRGYLQQAGLESFVRTSGGKGLHLVVPLAPAAPWERARAFAEAVAEATREADPLRYVATASKKLRRGRIFIDWLRNGRGATSVASFSARARPGAPVAMPLRWEELGKVASGHAFDIRNAQARLKRLKSHPWAGIERIRQTLSA
ncbi:DNA ligase D [Lysobacter lycopersici]